MAYLSQLRKVTVRIRTSCSTGRPPESSSVSGRHAPPAADAARRRAGFGRNPIPERDASGRVVPRPRRSRCGSSGRARNAWIQRQSGNLASRGSIKPGVAPSSPKKTHLSFDIDVDSGPVAVLPTRKSWQVFRLIEKPTKAIDSQCRAALRAGELAGSDLIAASLVEDCADPAFKHTGQQG